MCIYVDRYHTKLRAPFPPRTVYLHIQDGRFDEFRPQIVDNEGGCAKGDSVRSEGSYDQHLLKLVAGVVPFAGQSGRLGSLARVPRLPIARILFERRHHAVEINQAVQFWVGVWEAGRGEREGMEVAGRWRGG